MNRVTKIFHTEDEHVAFVELMLCIAAENSLEAEVERAGPQPDFNEDPDGNLAFDTLMDDLRVAVLMREEASEIWMELRSFPMYGEAP